jgi:hypothetical protein
MIHSTLSGLFRHTVFTKITKTVYRYQLSWADGGLNFDLSHLSNLYLMSWLCREVRWDGSASGALWWWEGMVLHHLRWADGGPNLDWPRHRSLWLIHWIVGRCGGMVLPVEPCDGERVWSCTTCGEQMEVQTVVDLVTAASDRLGKHEEVSSLRILRHLNQCFNSIWCVII